MYYVAVFMPTKAEYYAVEFPDFPEGFTQGKTLDECMIMGSDVLAITVEEYAKARKELPQPSSMEQIRIWAQSKKEDPDIATGDFLFQLFKAPEVDLTPVKISVSFPKNVLAELDEKASAAGMTRSGYLAKAAMDYSHQSRAETNT
jgi:predicted RNase H-like HicB family nuclease